MLLQNYALRYQIITPICTNMHYTEMYYVIKLLLNKNKHGSTVLICTKRESNTQSSLIWHVNISRNLGTLQELSKSKPWSLVPFIRSHHHPSFYWAAKLLWQSTELLWLLMYKLRENLTQPPFLNTITHVTGKHRSKKISTLLLLCYSHCTSRAGCWT